MTDKEKIRNHLLEGKSITPLEALNLYGCLRLGARIYDLRAEGLDIVTERVTTEDGWYGRYYLKEASCART